MDDVVVRCIRADPCSARHPDLVARDLTATRSNRLWVIDLTYVPTWAGVAYVCFIVDAFSRMIVGWRVASSMRTDMVLDALEMARWSRGTRLEGLVTHSDAGFAIHIGALRRTHRRDHAQPSIGSVGDSYDNALAETVNGLHKTELSTATSTMCRQPSSKQRFYATRQADQQLVGIQ